jgi:hypothetical protein
MSRYVQTLLVFQAGHCVLIHPIQQLRSPIGYPRGTTGTGPAVSTGNDARSASNEFSERTQHCVRRRIRQCLDHIDQRLQQIDHLVLALHQCQQRSHLRQQVGSRGTGGRLRGQSRKPLQLSASRQLQFWSGERVGHCPILRPAKTANRSFTRAAAMPADRSVMPAGQVRIPPPRRLPASPPPPPSP